MAQWMAQSVAAQSGEGRPVRRLFLILSPRSLDYARLSIHSLFNNALEDFHLHLITDSAEDRQALIAALPANHLSGRHQATVYAKDDLADREADRFARHPHIRQFRHGHPCWRKITDPLLLTEDGEEMVLLDPDLYFPNPFAFEPTPARGIFLMWQRPTCFMRPDQVRIAMDKGIRLANHIDIGVGHWRAPIDLDWLDWLLAQFDFPSLRRYMHMEAFVWSALAMHLGGGHLDPAYWHCWQFTISRRLRLKFGAPKMSLVGTAGFPSLKCFHAGGLAKYWIAEAHQAGLLASPQRTLPEPGRILPFEELQPGSYKRELKLKETLGKLGYYKFFRQYTS
jgi:hypothetical protein